MMGECQWDSSMALTCSSATRQATNTFRSKNGTVLPTEGLFVSNSIQTLPNRGPGHDGWSFDVSCEGHGYALGMKGNAAALWDFGGQWVNGFHLHCSDNTDSADTDHHKDPCGDVFDFRLQKPMRRMVGCVLPVPDYNQITYWASSCSIESSGGDSDKYVIDTSDMDVCSDDVDAIQFQLDCGDGLVMQRFQGAVDTPDGHETPFITQMDITCVPFIDRQRSMPTSATVLV